MRNVKMAIACYTIMFVVGLFGLIYTVAKYSEQKEVKTEIVAGGIGTFYPVAFNLSKYKNAETITRLISTNCDWEIKKIAKEGQQILDLMGELEKPK